MRKCRRENLQASCLESKQSTIIEKLNNFKARSINQYLRHLEADTRSLSGIENLWTINIIHQTETGTNRKCCIDGAVQKLL